MSNLIFPPTLRYAYSLFKIPTWATRTQRAVSGRELTQTDYSNPIWNFKLNFEVLRDRTIGSLSSEIWKLVDFYQQVQGGYDTWLYTDPNDNTTTDSSLGVGDGVATTFQLVRRLYPAGFIEDIIAPNTITNVKINGTPTILFSLDTSTGILTFPSPPAVAATITSTFSFYFRCRFMTDAQEFENFASLRWEVKELKFKSVVL